MLLCIPRHASKNHSLISIPSSPIKLSNEGIHIGILFYNLFFGTSFVCIRPIQYIWEAIDSVYDDKREYYVSYFLMSSLFIETICTINVYKYYKHKNLPIARIILWQVMHQNL